MRTKVLASLAFLVACGGVRLHAQFPEPRPPGVGPLPDTLARRDTTAIVALEPDTGARLRPLVGIHWTTSTGVTAHLGLMFAGPQGRHGEYGGPVVSAEVGQHGWKGGIGLGAHALISDILLRASYLRSWGDDGPLVPGQGYVGVDGRIAISHVAVGIGWHARVSGEAPDDGSIFTFSIGLGI
jgi:hypothetical protein